MCAERRIKFAAGTVVFGRIGLKGGIEREMVSRGAGCATLWWALTERIRVRVVGNKLTASPLKKIKTAYVGQFFEINHTNYVHVLYVL